LGHDVKIPESITIEVLEETPQKLYVVLPRNTSDLSDEELEMVSGGIACLCV